MSSAKKTGAPSPSPDEQSAVRARRASNPELTPLPRAVRIEQKLALARSLLAELPADDARGQLLHIALLRRDEVLLDGILASLK